MKQRKDGDKILINGRVATVRLRPASASGLQLIIYDDAKHWFFGRFELRDWRELAGIPDAEQEQAHE